MSPAVRRFGGRAPTVAVVSILLLVISPLLDGSVDADQKQDEVVVMNGPANAIPASVVNQPTVALATGSAVGINPGQNMVVAVRKPFQLNFELSTSANIGFACDTIPLPLGTSLTIERIFASPTGAAGSLTLNRTYRVSTGAGLSQAKSAVWHEIALPDTVDVPTLLHVKPAMKAIDVPYDTDFAITPCVGRTRQAPYGAKITLVGYYND